MVIRRRSRSWSGARSSRSARGTMQLGQSRRPSTLLELDDQLITNPLVALEIGRHPRSPLPRGQEPRIDASAAGERRGAAHSATARACCVSMARQTKRRRSPGGGCISSMPTAARSISSAPTTRPTFLRTSSAPRTVAGLTSIVAPAPLRPCRLRRSQADRHRLRQSGRCLAGQGRT